jgi:predicted nucleotidyltransferase
MNRPPLTPREFSLLEDVFRAHPEISEVRLFGSRAKGTHKPHSDVDLALWGRINSLQTEAIAGELDELPLPYHFDVVAFDLIKLQSLREHIERVGIRLFPEPETVFRQGCSITFLNDVENIIQQLPSIEGVTEGK